MLGPPKVTKRLELQKNLVYCSCETPFGWALLWTGRLLKNDKDNKQCHASKFLRESIKFLPKLITKILLFPLLKLATNFSWMLNPFSANVPLLYPWKHQKTSGLLMFSGGQKWKIGWTSGHLIDHLRYTYIYLRSPGNKKLIQKLLVLKLPKLKKLLN